MRVSFKLAAGLLGLAFATSAFPQDNKLRLITWADYVPADVVAQFKKESGNRCRDHTLE
jgi:spermidine/putrescine transport system substrate-binding protein